MPIWTCCEGAHREANTAAVMCRDLISVDWQGLLYDCDFNQMLGLPLGAGAGTARPTCATCPGSILEGAPIAVADHCYGCTAGQGSSCGGRPDHHVVTAQATACDFSIVIPTLNEAAHIGALLADLAPARAAGRELILVDGGSADGNPGSGRARRSTGS